MKNGQDKYGNQNTRNKVIYRYESSHGKKGMKAMVDLKMLEEKTPILKEICSEKEVFWKNPDKTACGEAMEQIELGMEDVEDAKRRLERFAPFIMKCFPETKERNGNLQNAFRTI